MAGELRFDCKYCNNSVYAPYSQAGKRVKCPHCKNPVVVPMQGTAEAPQDAQAPRAEEIKQVKRKDERKRPVQTRPMITMGEIIKLCLLGVIIFVGYRGYKWYNENYQKKVPVLLKEYDQGKKSHKTLILVKIKKGEATAKDIDMFKAYSTKESADTRALVAECLGQIGDKNGFETLQKMLQQDRDKEVRKAAATALGSIETRVCVEFLIQCLKQEKDDEVRGKIANSLRDITGNRDTTREANWEAWWRDNKHRKFADDK